MPTSLPGPNSPEPSAVARLHSEQLVAALCQEIDRAGGWISFARFMDLALYAPGLGYYMAGATKLGAAGDFVTAPGLSVLFGRTLAYQIAQVLALTGGDVLELGAGSGAMACDVLAELCSLDRLPRRYLILETSPQLVQRQRDMVSQRQPGLSARVEWVLALPQSFDGVIIANEVLDALPVHLIAWREEGLYERGVSWSGGFAWEERLLQAGLLRDAVEPIGAQPPYISEISLMVPALVRTLAAGLRAGALLLIDYGFGRREYYHPQRSQGTLMCHYRHWAHDDPFYLPGLQDISAHVDFTAVAEAGVDAGLSLLGYTTQAHFLINSGITGLLEQTGAEAERSRFTLSAGAQKLLSPAEMGELFKVVALGRGVDVPLLGFTTGDKTRLL